MPFRSLDPCKTHPDNRPVTRRLKLRCFVGLIALAAGLLLSGCSGVSSGSQSSNNQPSGQGSLSVAPASLDFGNVAVGGAKTSTVTLSSSASNSGNITVSQISVSGADFSIASGPQLPLTLTPGQSANVSVTFSPKAGGSSSGTLSITSDATNSPSSVPLAGIGLGAGQLGVSPATINFGNVNVGGSANQTGTLTAGATDIHVSSAAWNGQGYSVSGITFPVTVPAGKDVNYTVTFTPQAPGSAPGSISFVSDANNSPTDQTLQGSGTQTGQQHNVALSWNASASSGVIGYYVYRGTQPGGPYPNRLTSTPQPGTNFTDSSVSSGTTYYYVATAVDSNNNESVRSNEATASIP